VKYYYVPGSAAAHDRAVAELGGQRPAPPAPYAILRPAQPYDLTTPGTPAGLLAVARAAEAGAALPPPGGWRHRATFALASTPDGAEIVASLCLRLVGDLPGRPRRAWVAYVRTENAAGEVSWKPNGAALLDPEAERPMRVIGIEELKATLRGEQWRPPPPRPGPPRMRCFTCDAVTAFSTKTWRPYARHRCDPTHVEGRS